MANSPELKIIAKLCVEQWKLIQRFQKIADYLPEAERTRFASQIRYSELQLGSLSSEANLSLLTFEGEQFGPGCPASADNLDEFSENAQLVVLKTIEPAIVSEMRVILSGRVLVSTP